MKKLEEKELKSVMEMLKENDVELGDNYVAIEVVEFSNGESLPLVKESEVSFEDAAESLWRMECDCIEVSMEYGITCHVKNGVVMFVSADAAFVSDGIYGAFHEIFDNGHCSFMEMMWFELAADIKDAYKGKETLSQAFSLEGKNDNGWTMEKAVDEMVALWQSGASDQMPWDICGDWQFIDEEFYAVLNSPCFD